MFKITKFVIAAALTAIIATPIMAQLGPQGLTEQVPAHEGDLGPKVDPEESDSDDEEIRESDFDPGGIDDNDTINKLLEDDKEKHTFDKFKGKESESKEESKDNPDEKSISSPQKINPDDTSEYFLNPDDLNKKIVGPCKERDVNDIDEGTISCEDFVKGTVDPSSEGEGECPCWNKNDLVKLADGELKICKAILNVDEDYSVFEEHPYDYDVALAGLDKKTGKAERAEIYKGPRDDPYCLYKSLTPPVNRIKKLDFPQLNACVDLIKYECDRRNPE